MLMEAADHGVTADRRQRGHVQRPTHLGMTAVLACVKGKIRQDRLLTTHSRLDQDLLCVGQPRSKSSEDSSGEVPCTAVDIASCWESGSVVLPSSDVFSRTKAPRQPTARTTSGSSRWRCRRCSCGATDRTGFRLRWPSLTTLSCTDFACPGFFVRRRGVASSGRAFRLRPDRRRRLRKSGHRCFRQQGRSRDGLRNRVSVRSAPGPYLQPHGEQRRNVR